MNTLNLSSLTIQNTIQCYFDASQQRSHKVEAMVACFAENSVSYDPAEGPALEGRDGLRQFFEGVVSLFQDIRLTADYTSINGNEAAVKWSGYGISLSGNEVQFEGIDWFEFNAQGQIQSMKAYWNPSALLAQLNPQETL